jgi:hypothetical protein
MKKIRLTLIALSAVVVTLVVSSLAQAQATRTWVSGTGNDANPCTRTQPCATFAAALALTAPGGEISVIDAGSYGAVTITKSVTINGTGTLAGVFAGSTDAVIVNAGPSDTVILRHLEITGGESGLPSGRSVNAITYLGGKELHVEGCRISNLSSHGINVSLSGSGVLAVKDTIITGVDIGARLTTSSGSLNASFDEVRIQGARVGIEVLAGSATISRSNITHATGEGVLEGVRFVSGASLHIEDTVISNMTNGINVALNQIANAEVYIIDSYIRNNSNVGIFVSNSGTGLIHMVVERTTSKNNSFGLIGRSHARIAVRDSAFSGNSMTGILAEVVTAGPVSVIDVINCAVTSNGTGLSSGNSAQINQGNLRVSGTTISFNGTGVTTGNGSASTFGDNILRDNIAPGAFTMPALVKQ